MRAVVIGAGIIGLSAAYELAKDGHDVTVVDAGQPGEGSTGGGAAKIALAETTPVPAPGMVMQGIKWMLDPDSPLYIRPSLAPDFVRFMLSMARHCNREDFLRGLEIHLALASTCLASLDEWRHDGISFEEHRRGGLLAYEHAETFRERLSYQNVFERFGFAAEVLDAQALHDKEPALSERINYGLYYTQDGQVEPRSISDSLSKALTAMGAAVLAHTSVSGFEGTADRLRTVLTESSSLPCDLVVLAAGVFCGPLSKKLRSPVPIRPGKGYSVDYVDSPTALTLPLTFEDAHVAVSPLDGGLRIAGTMEFAGFDTAVKPRRVEAMKHAAAAGFADWDPTKTHSAPWAGLRPMTPDGLPVIGYLPGYGNVLIASGHGMLGLTLAPATAKAIASFSRGEEPSSVIAAVSPSRFRGRAHRSADRVAHAQRHTG